LNEERARLIKKLEEKAKEIRYKTVCLAYKAGKAHTGPSLSTTDILVALYYYKMNINPKNPKWVERDKFILSKGHGCVSFYVILAELGYYL
jgi:transketolase